MKEVDVIEIDNMEFVINKVINKYYYCSNIKDLKDTCILKKEIENDEEVYLPLTDEEFEEAVKLYHENNLN